MTLGLLDRARDLLRPPADRRLAAAEREAWATVPAPSHALALRTSGAPTIDWFRDQPPAPPQSHTFAAGYSDHAYQQFSAPLTFDGFSLEAIRGAVARHRLGFFWETSALMVAVCGFAPVLAGLQQAVAPILALPRRVRGGDKGLARLVRAEVEAQLVPEGGLLPSPFFAPTLWGTLSIYLRMMGFAVLQHVDGEPDPETGVRPRWTRIWEPWAVQRMRSPRKTIAMTTEGPIEIKNDGKFTLVEDENEGHLTGAILALGEETLAGKLTQEARNSFLDYFGKPKLWGKLPPNVPSEGEAGDAFFASVNTIFGPDGRGILPDGSDLRAVAISGEGSSAFREALTDAIIHIFMILTGSAGTIGSGAPTGAGPYQAAKGGVWNVRHDLIARPAAAIVRAVNAGHVAPYCDQNYAEGIAAAKRAGVWRYPVLEIPIASPDRDERIAAEIARQKALSDQVTADRAAGAIVDDERVEKLAARFEALPFRLLAQNVGEISTEHITNKMVAPDEVRARIGLPPMPDGMGSLKRLAEERAAGADEAGALAKVEAADAAGEKPAEAAPSPDSAGEKPADETQAAGPQTQRSARGEP